MTTIVATGSCVTRTQRWPNHDLRGIRGRPSWFKSASWQVSLRRLRLTSPRSGLTRANLETANIGLIDRISDAFYVVLHRAVVDVAPQRAANLKSRDLTHIDIFPRRSGG